MSLKRHASAVDEVSFRRPAKVAHTEMPYASQMSDAEFDDWLKQQAEHDMLQIWMKLTTAATKAQVKYTENLYGRFKTSRPEIDDYMPKFSDGSNHVYVDGADIDKNVTEWQAAWQAEQDRIEEMHQQLLTLVERAERVQTKMFADPFAWSKEDEEEVEKGIGGLHVVEEKDGSKTYYRSLGAA